MLFLLREGDFERKTRNPQKEEQYSMKSKVLRQKTTIVEERVLVETNGELTGEGKKEEGIRQNEGFTRRTNIDGVTNVVLDEEREF